VRAYDLERALHFTLALGEHTPGSYKAGLTLQQMYAGVAGNARRAEWTCYGDGINLAPTKFLVDTVKSMKPGVALDVGMGHHNNGLSRLVQFRKEHHLGDGNPGR
jgi:hypothetical protein